MAQRYEITESVSKTLSVGAAANLLQVGSGLSAQVKDLQGNNLTVYQAETGSSTFSNPLTTDSNGRIEGWVEAPDFDIAISGTGITTYTQKVRQSPAGVFNVKSYGATGDGSTNDATAAQAALTACNTAGGGVVRFTGGSHPTYKINSGLTVYAKTAIELDPDVTLDFSGGASNMTLIYGAGTLANGTAAIPGNFGSGGSGGVALSANTTIAASSVSVAAGAEAGFAADDWVLIGSGAYYETRTSLYGASTGQRLGELATVASTASGSITLRAPLAGGYTDTAAAAQLNYKTADTAFIQKIVPLEGISIEGGTIIGVTGSGSGSQQGIVLHSALAPRIRNVRFKHVGATCIQLQNCVSAVVENIDVFDSWSTGSGYAVAVGDASQDCTVRDVTGRNLRHLFTTTSAVSSYGVTRRITIEGCHAYNSVSTGDQFDTHAAAEDITFIACHAYGSAEYGFNIECSSATVADCVVVNSQKEGIYYHNETSAPGRFSCSNNRVVKAGLAGSFAGIRYTVANATGMGTVLGDYTFSGNTVIQSGGVGFNIAGSVGTPFTGVTLTGNIVENSGSTNGAFFLDQLNRCAVVGNVIRNLSANSTGIRLGTMAKATVSGNVIDYLSIGTGSGILGVTATDCAITGNTITNGSKGINLDSACTTNTVVGNNAAGCTTPLSLSTGAGNVAHSNEPGVAVSVASAATIALPGSNNGVYNITGTTNIDTITAVSANRIVVLKFAGVLTVGDGTGNCKLSAAFATTADDTLTLACDGTSWYEIARSVN